MSRLVLIAVAACLVAPGDLAEAKRRKPRKGGVVRVERASKVVRDSPRVVQIASQTQLMSYGWEPDVGMQLALVDNQGVAARARVTAVTERAGTCNTELYDIEFEVGEWERPFNYNMYGVAGIELDDTAKAFHPGYGGPSGSQQEYVWTAVDRDGDGVEDMIATHFPCPDGKTPGQSYTSSSSTSHCVATYTREASDDDWEKASHAVWYQCR